MDGATDIKPIIAESSTSESTNVEVVLSDIKDGIVRIPDYQRDSDQWDEQTKSLLVESVINNLSIPAFFFEVILDRGIEYNEVIDGQQRLTTLNRYYQEDFALVGSEDAPYLSPNSIHYAGKKFGALPQAYKQAFKKYRLAVIKLRNLEGEMRLEIFRRINQGGTPLSGQDIRLAYYGEKSPSLALIRIAGIYDPERDASKRFLDRAQEIGLSNPWKDRVASEVWKDWWEDKTISRGQTASEAFLWSLVVAQVNQLNSIMTNQDALKKLNVGFNRDIDAALDAYSAQLRWQETHSSDPPALMTFDEMRDSFFPHFEHWIKKILGEKGVSLPVTKHRIVAAVIGASYRGQVDPARLNELQWSNIVEFVRRPAEIAKTLGIDWPMSKGRWDGQKGYSAQMEAAYKIIMKITQ
jgi:Protein of unknown function DUF262